MRLLLAPVTGFEMLTLQNEPFGIHPGPFYETRNEIKMLSHQNLKNMFVFQLKCALK